MSLPPSIEAIVAPGMCGDGTTFLHRTDIQRIAHEACRLQREADEEIGRSYAMRFRIRNAPLVVPEPKP